MLGSLFLRDVGTIDERVGVIGAWIIANVGLKSAMFQA